MHNRVFPQCSVVGTSGILLHSECGRKIDQSDFVFRFNVASVRGFEKDVGSKTSLMTFNPSCVRLFNITDSKGKVIVWWCLVPWKIITRIHSFTQAHFRITYTHTVHPYCNIQKYTNAQFLKRILMLTCAYTGKPSLCAPVREV